jgi:hypothetical protein
VLFLQPRAHVLVREEAYHNIEDRPLLLQSLDVPILHGSLKQIKRKCENKKEREKERKRADSHVHYHVQFEVYCNLPNKSQRGLLFDRKLYLLDLMEFEKFLTCLQESPDVIHIEEAQHFDEFLRKNKDEDELINTVGDRERLYVCV